MHACDRQTDRRTDRMTTPKTALAYARAVKMCGSETQGSRAKLWPIYTAAERVRPLDPLNNRTGPDVTWRFTLQLYPQQQQQTARWSYHDLAIAPRDLYTTGSHMSKWLSVRIWIQLTKARAMLSHAHTNEYNPTPTALRCALQSVAISRVTESRFQFVVGVLTP